MKLGVVALCALGVGEWAHARTMDPGETLAIQPVQAAQARARQSHVGQAAWLNETQTIETDTSIATQAALASLTRRPGLQATNSTLDTIAAGNQTAPDKEKGQKEAVPRRIFARCRFAQNKKIQVYRVFLDPRGGEFPNFCSNLESMIREFATDHDGEKLKTDDIHFRRCDLDSQDDLSGTLGWVASFTLGHWEGKKSLNAWNRQSMTNATLAALELSRPGTIVDWMEQIGCYPARGIPPRVDY